MLGEVGFVLVAFMVFDMILEKKFEIPLLVASWKKIKETNITMRTTAAVINTSFMIIYDLGAPDRN